MAFYEGYGAPAPYATAAYGYSAPAPYAVPPMPGAYGVGAGAVDELRCDLGMISVERDPRRPTGLACSVYVGQTYNKQQQHKGCDIAGRCS